MKLIRFLRNGAEGCGILEDGLIYPVADIFNAKKMGGSFAADEVKLLRPCMPGKIVCGGLNYKDHAAEMKLPIPDEPIIFIKPSTAALDPGGIIKYPAISKQVDYEAELGAVIGRTCRNVGRDEAKDYILG